MKPVPEPGAVRFARRYAELRLTLLPLRGCPPMRGIEHLSPTEADWLLEAIEAALRRQRGKGHWW